MNLPVFRFAPSPNGLLHLGHAYSALLNRDMTEAAGGRLLLRIEDIDPGRCTPDLEQAILEDLHWLGVRWEGAVRRQSQHLPDYARLLARLQAGQLVYPCFCSRGDVRAAVAAGGPDWPRDPDGAPVYPGTCRNLPPARVSEQLASGQPHVWRLDMKVAVAGLGGTLRWSDAGEDGAIRDISADPAAWGDPVLARRDVPTSYHLSVVHDDALQGITHVVRGRDLYFATSLHRLLQELLGLPAPVYRHHRLILGEDGRKLAKSAGSASLRDLRETGHSPEDIRMLVGLSPPRGSTAMPPP
ncbi:tRNA glutamyl-Q(34) synthetase GluQRS [Terrihabitans rhizophilus]|uniref:tRNA glutamyl-Q(34) synthetase GluQRS n=1 Tax=Terrihabitans rhizophilus TaxID=3092662 RepID=A0ABU4RRU4_9HYPH|nr:tRNA glutamyl-Q(34) synthetase GluQRS [Terrihabitans sp. PJ23]MDX6807576.1 tRNA glutamyl-Q(34) synthetase GluQRS [Terrihabitans sp. PJ23]